MLSEQAFLPYEAAGLPAGPWVVFAPHADDETFGMGGTLLLGARQGIAVTLVVLTDGSQGGDQTDLASIREAEAKEAARRLGVGETLFWRQRDRELRVTAALVAQVAELVQEKAPGSVFFPSPFEPHPDHRAAAALVWAGLKSCGEFRGTAYAYEISVQGPVNRLMDITAVVADKRAVMAVYKSQLSQNRYVDLVLALNTARTYTLPPAVTHAEGFYAYEAVVGELAEQVIGSLAVNWRAQAEPATSRPLVSVIIRTKDRPVLLREALQSLATQTYAQLEVLVVNDRGCNVAEVVNAFAGGLIAKALYFDHQPGAGRAAAANVGLQNATGKYCLFLDDDDWLLPDHIGALVNVLEMRQDIGVAYAGVRCVQQDNGGQWRQVHTFNDAFDPTRLLLENYIPIHAALFRRNLVDSGCRFDERLELYEDWDFWVQLSRKTAFLHIDQISAVYRISAAGGFGITGDSTQIVKGLDRFFRKWRLLWTLDEALRIRNSYFALKTAANNQSQEFQAQICQLQGQLLQFQNQLNHAQEQLMEKERGLIMMQTQLGEAQALLLEKERGLIMMQTQLGEAQALLLEKERGLTGLQTPLGEAQALLLEKERGLAGLQTQLGEAQALLLEKERGLTGLQTQLGEAQALLSGRAAAIAKLSEERAAKEEELVALRWRLEGVEEHLQSVLRSKSLRLTAPLRAAWRVLGRVYGGGRRQASK